MSRYSLTTLTDSALLRDLKTLVSQDRATTALLIAHLGEVDARRLCAPAGYPSMYEYCVQELHFSEQTAFKRIRVARVARQFPAVHGMLADGRLNLSTVVMLTGYLTPESGDELLAAAAHQSRAGVERIIAERFPQPDLSSLVVPVEPLMSPSGVSAGTVELRPAEHAAPASQPLASPAPPAKIAPLSPERYAIQCTVPRSTYEKLQHVRELPGHAVPSGDLAQLLDRALDALNEKLERRKFAKTEHPRACRASENARQVPASVKRTVWERDGGRCTFVGENGHRCESRTRLEYDHVEPVATGGHATVKGLRLWCRAHNQYAAECVFGRDFVRTKRELAQREAAG